MILDFIARDLQMWDPDVAEFGFRDPYEERSRIDREPEVGWDDPEAAAAVLSATVIEDARLAVPEEWRPEVLPYGGDPFFEADVADLPVFYECDLGEVA